MYPPLNKSASLTTSRLSVYFILAEAIALVFIELDSTTLSRWIGLIAIYEPTVYLCF